MAGIVLITACGNSSGSSTVPPATTTSAVVTSTTAEPVTTRPATPTTAAPPDHVPAVASRYGLLGWWSDGWVLPDDMSAIPLEGGEEYQVVMLDQPVTTAIGSVPTLCEPSQTPVLEFDPPLAGDYREPGAIAILADWELRPAAVRVVPDPEAIHRDAVAEVLSSLGIEAEPVIFQQLAADLEGDGTEEVLIVSKALPDDLFAGPGDYSVVVLRKLIEGEWQTAILDTSLGEADSAYILSHSIPAIADLNGDGTMEVLVDAVYYEGSGTTAYEYIDDDLGPQAVLGGGCGA